jgi:peptide/nickel transport system permease protein
MTFKPVILWTDALIYLLLVVVIIFAWYVRRNEHLLAPWRRVGHSVSGMMALTVLILFISIGLLDTIHFRPSVQTSGSTNNKIYGVQVLSLFDVIATPLRINIEKTYSAPFATHLYTRETIEFSEGKQVREFPRLEFGGAHLRNPEEQFVADVTWRTVAGLSLGLFVWSAFVILLVMLMAYRSGKEFMQTLSTILRNETEVPWNAVFRMLALIFSLLGIALSLSACYHIFGTDKVGQDVFYQSLKSIRTGLVIGTLTTLMMLPFALLLGIMAGYFRGWIDDVIQYIYTTLSSIPSVLLIAATVLMMQVYMETHPELFDTIAVRADLRLLFLCIILGVTSWTGLCRLLRGETLKIREMEYIQAAHSFGVSHWRIISRHILPNVMHIVLIATVMDFSGLVLAEAVLSYVGVGVDPSMISFGTMINAARLEMAREPMVWWALLSSFTFMFTLVLSANLFADAVQDAFNPRVRTLSFINRKIVPR